MTNDLKSPQPTAESGQPDNMAEPYWICRCGTKAYPLTDDTECLCSDIYEQEWTRVPPMNPAPPAESERPSMSTEKADLAQIPEPSTNYVDMGAWNLGCRESQLRDALSKIDGLEDQLAAATLCEASNLMLIEQLEVQLAALLKPQGETPEGGGKACPRCGWLQSIEDPSRTVPTNPERASLPPSEPVSPRAEWYCFESGEYMDPPCGHKACVGRRTNASRSEPVSPQPQHEWTGCQRGGNPANEDSYEWVRYCKNCGMEDTCEDPMPPCPASESPLPGREAQSKERTDGPAVEVPIDSDSRDRSVGHLGKPGPQLGAAPQLPVRPEAEDHLETLLGRAADSIEELTDDMEEDRCADPNCGGQCGLRVRAANIVSEIRNFQAVKQSQAALREEGRNGHEVDD